MKRVPEHINRLHCYVGQLFEVIHVAEIKINYCSTNKLVNGFGYTLKTKSKGRTVQEMDKYLINHA